MAWMNHVIILLPTAAWIQEPVCVEGYMHMLQTTIVIARLSSQCLNVYCTGVPFSREGPQFPMKIETRVPIFTMS